MPGPPVRDWSGIGPKLFGPVRWSENPDRHFLVRKSGPANFGPVRWSGIPDRLKLVRSGGPETRTGPTPAVDF